MDTARARTTVGAPARARARARARGADASDEPRADASARSLVTAVLLATAPADGGGPSAALEWEEGTVVERLVGQLEELGIATVHVVTRPDWADGLRRLLGDATPSVTVHTSPDLSEDLRTIAALAEETRGGVVVGLGEIVTHREALAGLLADPRVASGALSGPARLGFVFRIRLNRGRLVSAASPFHLVHHPTGAFLGVLKVGEADRRRLVKTARRLADLTAGGVPPEWTAELERKRLMWRVARGSAALRRAAEEGEGAGSAGAPFDPDAADGADRTDAADAKDATLARDGAIASDDALTRNDALDIAALLPEDPDDIVLDAEDEATIRRRMAVAPQDAASLLLVGLVRSGLHMTTSHVRKLFWARPLSDEGAREAAEQITEFDEDRVLLDSAVKATDGFFTTFFVSPYSKYIARWAARRGLTPNQVTTISLAIGVLAAVAFATGSRAGLIAGAVLLQLAFTTDCVDGQLARYTRTFSRLGAWLDSVFDRSKEYLVFAGLAIGASASGDPVWVLAGAALTLQTVRHMFDFSFAATRHEVIGAAKHQPLESASDWPPREPEAVVQATEAEEPPKPPLAKRVLSLWRATERVPGVVWLKRMIAFPIGERFAVISITAALATPRTTFTVMLVWGGVAAVYALAGRLLRSVNR